VSATKQATENQTRNVKTKNFVKPSVVMASVAMPMLTDQMTVPAVQNRMGIEINTVSKKMKEVREKKCFIGIRDAAAKMIGTIQIISMWVKSTIKRETTSIERIVMSFVRGFTVCRSPFLLLKSSTWTKFIAPSIKSRSDFGTFICLTLFLA
jgi:hypothetical protein